MRNIERKHQLYQHVGMLGRAIGHATRLELLEMLSQCPQTVDKLAQILDLDIKAVSAHLKVLARAGLVRSTREGRFIRYALTSPKVSALAVMLRETAEQIDPSLAGLVAQINSPVQMDLRQAVEAAERGQIMLIDVRSPEEFDEGHLPHAVNLPWNTIAEHAKDLPEDLVLVAYCRGPYCFQAREAQRRLENVGRRLRIVSAGVMEWSSRGEMLVKTPKEE